MSETLSHERPSLPASTSAFALPASARTTSSDELNPFMLHLHKPSLLNPKLSHLSQPGEKRHQSPLASSFTHRRRVSLTNGEDSESDKDSRVWASDRSSSLSSGNATPPQPNDINSTPPGLDDDAQMKLVGKLSSESQAAVQRRAPSTPPRKVSADMMEHLPSTRRLSLPPKPLRVLNLVAESEARPEDCELKSEAQFQRLVASCSDNPLAPKTYRTPSDRGRYPEEAYDDELEREDTLSDDEDEDGDSTFGYNTLAETLSLSGRGTPARSINGDDGHMSTCGSPGGYAAMDVDSVFSFGSPSISTVPNQWRYTPPSTSSAVRSNKRKHDERYDPYPATKRRAVSPSVSLLRGSPRISIPISVPITIPNSSASSANSSPIITQLPSLYYQSVLPRSVGSPIVGSAMGLAASPVLRPMARSAIRREGEERDVDSAGDGVSGLNLE